MKRSLLIKAILFIVFVVNISTMEAQTAGSLDKHQQSIVRISALTATGDTTHLKDALQNGLDAGVTINEIKEVLVHLYAYCGFPRSLNGINTFMSVLEQRKKEGRHDTEGKEASPFNDANRYATGKKTLQTLTGKEEKAPAAANAFAPAIDTFLKEHLFADIFSRDVLTYLQRELVTVSALASMSGVSSQLQSHITIALNIGLTEAQLLQAFSIIEKEVGNKQAAMAKETLAKVMADKQSMQ